MTACGPLCGLLGTGKHPCTRKQENAVFRPCGENQPTTQRSGRGLERRRSEMSELCRRRQSEEYGACADENQGVDFGAAG